LPFCNEFVALSNNTLKLKLDEAMDAFCATTGCNVSVSRILSLYEEKKAGIENRIQRNNSGIEQLFDGSFH
jgi:hypothetical protein